MLGREPLGSELDLDAEGWKLSVELWGSVVAIGIILLSIQLILLLDVVALKKQ